MNKKKTPKFSRELITILVIMLTESLGFSIILPYLNYFAKDLGASPLTVGLISASFSLCQFISAPIIGELSDKFGRKPLLIISQISTFMGFLLLALANSIPMLFISRIVDGLLGSNWTVTKAYLGDITKGDERKKTFGYIGAITAIGFFIGPAIGGPLAKINYSIPAFISAGISLISIFMTAILLEETVKKDNEFNLALSSFFPMRSFIKNIRLPKLRRDFIQFFLFNLAFVIFTANAGLYVDYQLGFGPEDVGIMFFLVGLTRIIFQSLVYPKLIEKFNNKILLTGGSLLLSATLVSMYFIRRALGIYIAVPVFSIGAALTHPSIQDQINQKTKKRNRGKIMGITGSLQSIAQILAPIIGGIIINNFYPGNIGLLAGALMIFTALFEIFGA
ncbi:MFS transporter [Candidatus Dojkabacteria bacterium]|nr:MFS transporter [Candidatus Dojkabacteria bacterium]